MVLLVFIVISSVTGLLLAWKKQVSWLQPSEMKGVSTNVADWVAPIRIADAAKQALSDSLKLSIEQLPVLDRLDARPKHGMVKVLFKGDWEVQVDATTAAVYSVAKRNVDWIERLHDGSIVADWFKNLSMTLLAIGLLFLSATGFWMWKVRSNATPNPRNKPAK
jgi:uncharacterized iron-regulated membrane protein